MKHIWFSLIFLTSVHLHGLVSVVNISFLPGVRKAFEEKILQVKKPRVLPYINKQSVVYKLKCTRISRPSAFSKPINNIISWHSFPSITRRYFLDDILLLTKLEKVIRLNNIASLCFAYHAFMSVYWNMRYVLLYISFMARLGD